ncbi:MAG: hypothetical protein KatS3mg083_099 [Candidatus Dojkabacteria bacterium]|nr:MAG: hypothetical protein KatS3mg083_099 [Candidatus Dojkabacteria bacterium]
MFTPLPIRDPFSLQLDNRHYFNMWMQGLLAIIKNNMESQNKLLENIMSLRNLKTIGYTDRGIPITDRVNQINAVIERDLQKIDDFYNKPLYDPRLSLDIFKQVLGKTSNLREKTRREQYNERIK